ncbi:hypothetical protein [Nonomuraea glycinis]|uniref:hypothetical protein n=1 Tax=Nonomuraea glycinis TaxID=2047744 RepID=UPI002E115805|nr:hypothetical protein OHA68_43630 [Nonomuraea glycinis]
MWRTLSSEAHERIGELCDEHGRHLYDYCRTALAGSDAELAVADALLSAHAHEGRLAEPRLLRPWLYALARAHRAAIATTRPASTGSWSRPGVAPDLVPEGLMALDGPHRELLDLSVRHGLTNAEIAVIFDAEAYEVAAIVAEAADTLEEWFAAVRAARTREGCPRLATRVTDWTKAPGRRNRTRIARHILSCSGCRAAPRTVRAATLLHRLPLAAVPSTLRDQPAWGRPLPADDPLWRPDGFPHQARGLVEPPPAMISLVPGPTTETREPSWPVAGAAATGQEPPRTGTAPFAATAPAGAPKGAATGGTPSRVSSGSIASGSIASGAAPGDGPGDGAGTPGRGGVPLSAPIGKAPFGTAPGAPLRPASEDIPAQAAANGIQAAITTTAPTAAASGVPPGTATGGTPHSRDPAGGTRRGREPLSPSVTALLDTAHQPGEHHPPGPTIPEQQGKRPTALAGPDQLRDRPTGLPEIPSQRRTPTRQAAESRSAQEPPDLARRLLRTAADQVEAPDDSTPRRSAEPGDKLVFSGERPPRERPVQERDRPVREADRPVRETDRPVRETDRPVREAEQAQVTPSPPIRDPQAKREQIWALQPPRPGASRPDRLFTQSPDRQNGRNPDTPRVREPERMVVPETGGARVREPERVVAPEAGGARVREPERVAPEAGKSQVWEVGDEQWEEFWEGRPDEDDPEARISLRWLVRMALVIGLVMVAGGLTWSVFRHQTSGKAASVTGPTALAPGPSAAAPPAQAADPAKEAPTLRSAAPTAEATDQRSPTGTAKATGPAAPTGAATPQDGAPRDAAPAGKAPPAPVARLSPESVQLGTRRTGTFKLSCTGDCQVTSVTASNGIVISGNTFTVAAPAERPGCSGPPVTESGVVTIGWSGTATGDGRGTEGTTAADGTLTMLVSWTVTSNKGAYIPDTNGGGYWSNCPKSE